MRRTTEYNEYLAWRGTCALAMDIRPIWYVYSLLLYCRHRLDINVNNCSMFIPPIDAPIIIKLYYLNINLTLQVATWMISPSNRFDRQLFPILRFKWIKAYIFIRLSLHFNISQVVELWSNEMQFEFVTPSNWQQCRSCALRHLSCASKSNQFFRIIMPA